ncbi:hypothetical protein BJF82_00695 [Kytococcus sp. CUA-901]|nr:hypothetical protein BJF82_00695 [Kytococcus sp. CUA-901]
MLLSLVEQAAQQAQAEGGGAGPAQTLGDQVAAQGAIAVVHGLVELDLRVLLRTAGDLLGVDAVDELVDVAGKAKAGGVDVAGDLLDGAGVLGLLGHEIAFPWETA